MKTNFEYKPMSKIDKDIKVIEKKQIAHDFILYGIVWFFACSGVVAWAWFILIIFTGKWDKLF